MDLKADPKYLDQIPKVGDKIYVGSSYYLSHGEDDFVGGLATISEIQYSKTLPNDHCNYIFVVLEERPGWSYNYRSLLEEQDKLKKEYEGKIAHEDPDPSACYWIEEGDIVNGEVYHGPPIK